MTTAPVWLSTIFKKTRYNIPAKPEAPGGCPFADMEAGGCGWPLLPEQVPTRLVAYEAFDVTELSHIQKLEEHYLLNDALAQVLLRFDLGSTTLTKVPFFSTDGSEIPGPWWHMHVSARKDTCVPTRATYMRCINPKRGLINGTPTDAKPPVAIEPDSVEGADLWRDPMWDSGLFFSDRLKTAIDVIGAGERFRFMATRFATKEDRENMVCERKNHETKAPWE